MFRIPIRFSFYDKLKLFNDFFLNRTIGNKRTWPACKAILSWSASPSHNYLGSYLGTDRVCRLFGFDKTSLEICRDYLFGGQGVDQLLTKLDEYRRCCDEKLSLEYRKLYKKTIGLYLKKNNLNKQGKDIPFKHKKRLYELIVKKTIEKAIKKSEVKRYIRKEENYQIVNELLNNRLSDVEPIIKNIAVLGFGDLKEEGVRINNKGFLIGELTNDLNGKFGFAMYFMFTFLFQTIVVLLISYTILYLIVSLAELTVPIGDVLYANFFQ